MVSQIQLGNIFQENGRTVIGGSQSGFDTKSLVDALAAVKAQPATNLTTKNKTIDGEVSAYGQLSSLLGAFKSAVDTLRNPPGVGNAAQNSFAYRTTSVTSSTSVAASSYLAVTASPGAAVQNVTVDSITQLATQSKQHTGVFNIADTTTASAVTANGSPTPGLFEAGSFTLKNINGGSDPTLTFNQGDSLQAVVNKFNGVTGQTGIQAGILQVGTGQYEITFTAVKTGAANGFDFTTGPGAGHTLSSDASGVFSQLAFTQTQGAQDAIFSVDGVSVQRANNSVNDVISGLTFNLQNATPPVPPNTATTLNVQVSPDTSIVSTAVQSFVDAYNALRVFFSTQTQRNADGTPKDTAVLATDPNLRTIENDVNNEVTGIVGGLASGNPKSLADIGITFSNFAGDSTNPATTNIMSLNTTTLNSALSSNFQGVANVFEFNLSSDNPALTIFKNTTNLNGVTSFQVNNTGGTFTATVNSQVINLTATPLANGGYTLTAPAGSPISGMTLIYASNADATVNINVTQGIADQLYNTINDMTNSTDGVITNAVHSLTDQETKNNTKIADINDQVSKYRDQLTQQYATLESALTKANSLLALLTAQSNAQISASGH